MAVLMESPEGALSQVGTTDAEYLKTLGWKELGYDEFYKRVEAKKQKKVPEFLVAKVEEPVKIETPSPKRMGRPPKVQASTPEVGDGNSPDTH